MKSMFLILSIIVLRCCWGPTDFQLMLDQQNEATLLKELNGIYQINTLKDEDVLSFNLNIIFNDSTKKVSGFSGCNRFFGSYTLKNNALSFSDLGLTRMLCSDDKNTIESNLLKAFKKANLVLFNENGFSLYKNKKILLSALKIVEENTISFEYSAFSRGSYKQIKIDKDFMFFSKKRDSKLLKKSCDSKFWNKLTILSNDLDFENLSNLEVPSKKFLFDGASLARLKIISNGKTYESAPFDHGNPPKEIEALVKEILSSAENIE